MYFIKAIPRGKAVFLACGQKKKKKSEGNGRKNENLASFEQKSSFFPATSSPLLFFFSIFFQIEFFLSDFMKRSETREKRKGKKEGEGGARN